MTKKHFIAIAAALVATRPEEMKPPLLSPFRAQWNNDVETIADALASINPRFDRERFYEACLK